MKSLNILSIIAGVAGIVLCVIAVLFRLSGNYYVANVETMTLFNVGLAGMVLGCLLKLQFLVHRLEAGKQ